jgi:cell division protein FtsB
MDNLFNGLSTKIMSAYELAKRFGNSELALEISNLQMDLANIKSAYADLKNENTELKSQIARLKEGKGGSSIGSAPVVRS